MALNAPLLSPSAVSPPMEVAPSGIARMAPLVRPAAVNPPIEVAPSLVSRAAPRSDADIAVDELHTDSARTLLLQRSADPECGGTRFVSVAAGSESAGLAAAAARSDAAAAAASCEGRTPSSPSPSSSS